MTEQPLPCSRNSLGWRVGADCTVCGHNGLLHPGAGGDVEACVICQAGAATAAAAAAAERR